jgi:hypothetical protein
MHGARFSVTLTNGRSIELLRLEQRFTYEGLLEGVPTREMNARTCESLRQQGYLVLSAVEQPIQMNRRYRFGTPARLPTILCTAVFRSEGFTNPILWQSDCQVAWFQARWVMPIDDAALDALRALDWRAHATEWER